MNQHFWKYIAGLLIFGSNGIVASHIGLNSYEIVYLRSGIGGMALVLFFLLGEGMGLMQILGTVLILGGAMFAEMKGKSV